MMENKKSEWTQEAHTCGFLVGSQRILDAGKAVGNRLGE